MTDNKSVQQNSPEYPPNLTGQEKQDEALIERLNQPATAQEVDSLLPSSPFSSMPNLPGRLGPRVMPDAEAAMLRCHPGATLEHLAEEAKAHGF